ncbi:transposase [Moraxella oculi]|uniref:Transposase n=1 Tax=Moraxella oculi TaxID=2940516 RepID=A0ABW8U571_9GAMM
MYGRTLFAIDYFEQNINTDGIYDWCKHSLIPKLKKKCVIVMDNASFHKSKRIQKIIKQAWSSVVVLTTL